MLTLTGSGGDRPKFASVNPSPTAVVLVLIHSQVEIIVLRAACLSSMGRIAKSIHGTKARSIDLEEGTSNYFALDTSY